MLPTHLVRPIVSAPAIVDHLCWGLEGLSLELEAPTVDRLVNFLELLERWNRTYNLTRVRRVEDMVARHLLDSLSVGGYLRGPKVLDLGTGPGLPGLVLAMAYPDLAIVVLDSNRKKAGFCVHAVGSLGIDNAVVEWSRADAYHPESRFSTIVTRAFGSLARICAVSRPLIAPGGRIVAMKGRWPQTELEELGAMGENATVVPINVPSLDASRHLVVIEQTDLVRGVSHGQ